MSSNIKSVNKETDKVDKTTNEIDDDFVDESSEKKAIIIIMIGILVIIGLIVGLLVIFDKDGDTNLKPDDKIPDVIPPDDTEDPIDTEDPVSGIDTDTDKVASSDVPVVEETVYYKVVFVFGNNSKIEKSIEKGKTVDELAVESLPKGYKYLGYYSDKEYNNVYDFSKPISVSQNIYIKTELITYTIKDAINDDELGEYNVEKRPFELSDLPSSANKVFVGWYLEDTFNTKVTRVDESLIENSVEILLYPKFVEKVTVGFETNDPKVTGSISDIVYDGTGNISLPSGGFTHNDGLRLLGWSTSSTADTVKYALGATITSTEDLTLYPAFGTYLVEINTNSNTEMDDAVFVDGEEFNFPDESALEPPKYYEKVDSADDGALLVVRKDNPEQLLNLNEIDIDEVTGNEGSSYGGAVEEGHYVVGKDKEFAGWTETVPDTSPEAEPGDTIEVAIPEEDEATWEPTEDTELNATWVEPIPPQQQSQPQPSPAPSPLVPEPDPLTEPIV